MIATKVNIGRIANKLESNNMLFFKSVKFNHNNIKNVIHKIYVITFSNHCQVITQTQSNLISLLFAFFEKILLNKYGTSDIIKKGVLYKDQALGSEFNIGK